jgi:hypothetical protein
MTVHVEVFVGEDAVRLIEIENTDDRDVALELALEHVRDNVGGEIVDDVLPDVNDSDVTIDGSGGMPITDAAMLAGAVQAGQAYQQRIDSDGARAATVDDRVTGLLIFDDQEAALIVHAFETLGLSGTIASPLVAQLAEWLAGAEDEAAA